jgi:hypothetical protein|nr:hypothetical protein [Kofleriaceae bacterium]
MKCARCHEPIERGARWCDDCERAYDTWVRRYASDMVLPLFAGGAIVLACGMGLPLLGVGWLIGGAGAFAGFATVGALARMNRWRRRRQFRLATLPRAALVGATMPR